MNILATIKQNVIGKVISDNLTVDGAALNLTGKTVKLVIRHRTFTYERTATVTDAVNGAVSYTTVAADTAALGYLSLEWAVYDGATLEARIPEDGYLWLRVIE